jgi:hypothetical protein
MEISSPRTLFFKRDVPIFSICIIISSLVVGAIFNNRTLLELVPFVLSGLTLVYLHRLRKVVRVWIRDSELVIGNGAKRLTMNINMISEVRQPRSNWRSAPEFIDIHFRSASQFGTWVRLIPDPDKPVFELLSTRVKCTRSSGIW